MGEFTGHVAIVTGGGSGIGRELCLELASRGAEVTVADIDADGAARTVADIEANGGSAIAETVDVSDEQAVGRLISSTHERTGRLDLVFNNAGIAISGDARDFELGHWRSAVAVNLWGVVYGTLAAYDIMTRQGHGHIVNIASAAGLLPFPMSAPYSMTKHAVVGFSRSLRAEGSDLGVNVSVVCPGFIRTEIYENATRVNVDADAAEIVAELPFRLMEPDRAVRLILRGVSRNKEIIVFTLHARVMWWISRLHPSLLWPVSRRNARDFRKFRGVSTSIPPT